MFADLKDLQPWYAALHDVAIKTWVEHTDSSITTAGVALASSIVDVRSNPTSIACIERAHSKAHNLREALYAEKERIHKLLDKMLEADCLEGAPNKKIGDFGCDISWPAAPRTTTEVRVEFQGLESPTCPHCRSHDVTIVDRETVGAEGVIRTECSNCNSKL